MVAMKKTDTFFIISNFNTDPERYLAYCEDYHIYDQTPDPELREKLREKYSKISFVENTGHNLSDYFRFFVEHYEELPARMMLAKGNMIGRHVTQSFFDRVYANPYYTMLYDDRTCKDKVGVAYQLYDGAYLEINNSWYALTKSHRYFQDFNDFLRFVFRDPIIPRWLLFSPGACYIVSREQVLKYPSSFYENLKALVSYTYFPAEAYMVERAMHLIFAANYTPNSWMLERTAFQSKLEMEMRRHSQIGRVLRRKWSSVKVAGQRLLLGLQEQYRQWRA